MLSVEIPLPSRTRYLANQRERQRVHELTDSFQRLRQVIPYTAELQLSRTEVLQRASGYIGYLTELLSTDEPLELPSVPVESSAALRKAYLESSDYPLRILSTKRALSNARARNRSRKTRAAFKKLKNHLPLFATELELSRVDILHQAAKYISFLRELLESDQRNIDHQPPAAESPSSPQLTLSALSELQRRVFPSCYSEWCDTSASESASCCSLLSDFSCNSALSVRPSTAIPLSDMDSDYGSSSPLGGREAKARTGLSAGSSLHLPADRLSRATYPSLFQEIPSNFMVPHCVGRPFVERPRADATEPILAHAKQTDVHELNCMSELVEGQHVAEGTPDNLKFLDDFFGLLEAPFP